MIAAPPFVDNVVVGGGVGAGAILTGLSKIPNAGKVTVITKGDRWPTAFGRHFPLGQSRQNLTIYPKTDFWDPKGKMTVDEHMHEIMDYQIKAVEPFNPDDLDCIESDVTSIVKLGPKRYLLTCNDGTSLITSRVFLTTGLGPERTLGASGVEFENTVAPKRLVHNEVSTALRSLAENPGYWKNKTVTIYGGGAVAAWVVEVAMEHGIANILWLSRDGFDGANPGNRNSDVMTTTKDQRLKIAINKVKYLGDTGESTSQDELELTLGDGRKLRTNLVISAAGSDPLAPTGIKSVLGPLYADLVPTSGAQGGVFGCTPDTSIIVACSALTDNPAFQKLIREKTFSVFAPNPENQVYGGLAVTKLSAEDAVEFATNSNASTATTTPPGMKLPGKPSTTVSTNTE